MDQQGAAAEGDQTTPIFGAYRRGYDPEQVDRYVAEQQRRLDAMTTRATEAERRLAAAVGQLRELHRRVAVLESEDRSPQAPALDTLGERVQRILQEAWEGAYALRQGAEQEVGEMRTSAVAEAEGIVEAARSKAQAMQEATERRRRAFLERMEEDRNRAVAQISYLHDQRRLALDELVKVKEVIERTVGEATFPTARETAAEAAQVGTGSVPSQGPPVGSVDLFDDVVLEEGVLEEVTNALDGALDEALDKTLDQVAHDVGPAGAPALERAPIEDPTPTMAVEDLGTIGGRRGPRSGREPVRSHGDRREDRGGPPSDPPASHGGPREATEDPSQGPRSEAAAVFDFEAEEP